MTANGRRRRATTGRASRLAAGPVRPEKTELGRPLGPDSGAASGPESSQARPRPTGQGWWLALGAAVALAGLLRLSALDRFPPGLHYDEAAYGLQALELLEHPRLQLFFPAFTGREPLFIYLLAGGLDLLGTSVWTIRVVAALVGTAAIVTTGLAGRALFGPAVGLLGAALLAASFWHVTISRMTYRAGLVAALTPLAIWLLWRAWRRPGLVPALLAGAALGLLAYTYVAIRLLPLALFAFVVVELAAGPLRQRRRLAAGAATALVAAAVAAPLGLYFLRHPDDFGVRFAQTVSLGKGDEAPAAPILHGIAATLGMYGLRGDVLEKYNLPLRPALDPLLAALFALGLVALLVRSGRSESRLTLAWLVGALAPGFVTADSPNFLRLIGAAPPSYLIAALGAATAARAVGAAIGALRHRLAAGPLLGARAPLTSLLPLGEGTSPEALGVRTSPDALGMRASAVAARARAAALAHARPARRRAFAVAAALLLVSTEAALTARDYFTRWAPAAGTYYALHGDLADLGRLAAARPTDETTYVASEHYRHPTVAFTAGPAFARLRWFDGRDALVLPPPGLAASYLIPRSARPPDLARLGAATASRLDPDGQPAVERFEPPAPSAVTTGGEPGLVFARRGGPPLAELLSVEPASSVRAGGVLPVRTTWRLLADSPAAPLELFAHLLNAGRRRWGQRDASPYLPDQWRHGETLIAWLRVPIDPTAPPGRYQLRLGLDDPSDAGAIEVRRPDGRPVGADRLLGDVLVAHADRQDAAARAPIEAELGPVSLAAAPPPARLTVGETAWVDLLWRARVDDPSGSAELLLRPAEAGASGPAGSPTAARSLGARGLDRLDPLAPWRIGETIRDARPLRPRAADAGRWTLVVRVGEREQPLGPVEVALPPAVFDRPRPQIGVDASFGQVARLLGIDLTPAGPRLYWQAIEPSEAPLAVFVHALGTQGEILAQHDGGPAGGRRPTPGWIPDEIVADDHPLALPPEWAGLAIGLYDPATGRRLSLPDGTDHVTVKR